MLVLLLISTFLPYGLFILKDASQIVQKDIYHYARGSYDILLRPDSSRTDIENTLGLVEENYLGIGDGGITIDQWKKVMENKEISIAAPVAAIGLFTASEVSYSLPLLNKPVHYAVDHSTTDGLHTYPLGDTKHGYIIPDDEREEGYTEIVSHGELRNVFQNINPSFLTPASFHQVVAIDPEQESLLTNNNFNILHDSGPSLFGGDDFTQIPILSLEDSMTPIHGEIQVNEVDIQLDDVKQLEEKYLTEPRKAIKEKHNLDYIPNLNFFLLIDIDPSGYQQLLNELANFPVHQSNTYNFTFSEKIAPFYDNYIYLNEQYELQNYEENPKYNTLGNIKVAQEFFYQVTPPEYTIEEDGNISIIQKGFFEDTNIPIHREIIERRSYTFDVDSLSVVEGEGINFYHAGYFEVELDDTSLAAAPLGIYGTQPTHLVDNPETSLHPTAVPGSFIATPAHGLISIEWAEQLKGEAPIDAIRVKVAGIEGYDVAAADKIKRLAQQLEDDGFTVDIIAGASHQSLTIDVEEVGEVVQPWTTLGAADAILQSWDIISLVVVIILAIVSMIYILFTFKNLVTKRRYDENILVELGWNEKEIKRLRRRELGVLLSMPLIIGIISLVFVTVYFHLEGLALTGFVVACCILIFAIIGAWIGRRDRTIKERRIQGAIPVQNVWHYRHSVFIALFQVIFMIIVSVFFTMMINYEREQTTITTLGVYVHAQVEWYTYALMIIIYLLTIITVIESLIMLWKQRKDEFLLFIQIGWSDRKIVQFYVKEIIIWLGSAIAIGTLISLTSYHWMIQPVTEQWGSLVGIFIGLSVILFILSYTILKLFLKQIKAT